MGVGFSARGLFGNSTRGGGGLLVGGALSSALAIDACGGGERGVLLCT